MTLFTSLLYAMSWCLMFIFYTLVELHRVSCSAAIKTMQRLVYFNCRPLAYIVINDVTEL